MSQVYTMNDFSDKKKKSGYYRARWRDRIRYLMGGIKVLALVGKSGTGKSFRARLVAETNGINYIIDDGLLIHGNSIIAGKSAKRESLYMGAIRTALFDDTSHRHEVIRAIKSRKVRRILLLGTSERMVARSAQRLELPPPFKIIHIEEISSSEDREKAEKLRNEEGKHVIPVPSIEVERNHPQLFSKSIRVFFKLRRGLIFWKGKDDKVYEKSVVQPNFQGAPKGRILINEKALGQMVAHCVDEFNDEFLVRKIKFYLSGESYIIRAELEAPLDHSLTDDLHELQNYVVNRIEKFTGIIIKKLDLIVASFGDRHSRKWTHDLHKEPEIEKKKEDQD